MRRTNQLALIALVAAVLELCGSPVSAQLQLRILPNGQIVRGGTASAQQLFPNDRELAQLLKRSRELLKKGNYTDGLAGLQRVIDHPEDSTFNPDSGNKQRFVSLKAEAQRIIVNLPAKGRRAYEDAYGSESRHLVEEATKTGDVTKLQEAARRYFHTLGGYRATHLLGVHHLDRSEPLAAALYFERLRKFPDAVRRLDLEPLLSFKTAVCWGRSGMPDQSVKTLIDLKRRYEDEGIELGGRQIAFFEHDEDALEWLVSVLGQQRQFATIGQEEWTMMRGNPSRNASSVPATPVWDSQWRYATITDPDAGEPQLLQEAADRLEQLRQQNLAQNRLTLPAAHPLVMGDTVVFRTMKNVRAVNLADGEIRWESTVMDRAFHEVVEQQFNITINRGRPQQSARDLFTSQRAWRDLTAGTLSSDGDLVYTVSDLGFVGLFDGYRRTIEHPLAPKNYNKLMAFELTTGKFKFEVGGERGDLELDLAGTFFLGPPLPLAGRLYCLTENNGEIRLTVLAARPSQLTAELLWSQTLVVPPQPVQNDPLRRLAGISPSYGDGVMICPTTAGAVVAVDLARRMLLWGYRYSDASALQPGMKQFGFNPAMMMRGQSAGTDDEDRWADAVATIAEGRILLTPRDSNELHCLNLVDGKVLWKKPRGRGLYVAAVDSGKVIVVGRNNVSAFNLADGKPAWKEPAPITMPSGRGYRVGRLYHVPLATSEIATIDLVQGRVVARSKTRSGTVPGNLVAAGGTVVSQTINGVSGFQSLSDIQNEISEGLKKNPHDARLLALRGEVRLHDGRESAGLDDLRKSIKLQPTARAREVVVATLLEGMRYDFAAYRKASAEIETLVDDPAQRARYLRLYAQGLHSIGEHREAFSKYLELAGPAVNRPELDRIDGSLSVRSDRWVRPRITELYHVASPEQQAEMQQEIRRLLTAAADDDENADGLRKVLSCFRDLPLADEVRKLLVERLLKNQAAKKDAALELEKLLTALRRSPKPEFAAYATGSLAALYLDLNRHDAAREPIAKLMTQWANATCFDGKTGRELTEGWRADEKYTAAFATATPAWPKREMQIKATSVRRTVQRNHPVPFAGGQNSPFENWSFRLDQNRRELSALDGNGAVKWRLPTLTVGGRTPSYVGNSVRTSGHMLLTSFGTHFAMLDGLTTADTPKMLWQLMPSTTQAGANGLQVQIAQRIIFRGGVRMITTGSSAATLGMGPLTDDLIVYQVGTRLHAADPLTGKLCWTRENMIRGSRIDGDDKYVLVSSPYTKQVTVLRASDGEYLTTRSIPDGTTRIHSQGRRLLTWKKTETNGVVMLTDLLTGKTLWQREFDSKAKYQILGDDEVAVLEPEGSFVVLNIDDGRKLVESPITADKNILQMHVRRSTERYLLLTYSPPTGQNNFRIRGQMGNEPMINGFAYGFDRKTGRKTWTSKIENQTLDVNQSTDLPILIFSAQLSPLIFRGGFNRTQPTSSFAILDVRSGKLVYNEKVQQSMSMFKLEADPAKSTINIQSSTTTIAVTFPEKTKPE